MSPKHRIEFEQLYEQYQYSVHRLCLGYLKGNDALAADMVQEIFIKVMTKWSTFKGKSKRSTWLFRIAVNTCLTELRRSKKFTDMPVSSLSQIAEEHQDTDKERTIRQLHQCINQLKPVNKTIILLEMEQVPQKEIATIMGLSHSAVRTRVNRIKSQLFKCITNEKL